VLAACWLLVPRQGHAVIGFVAQAMREADQHDPGGDNRETTPDAQPRQPVENTCHDRASFSFISGLTHRNTGFMPTCRATVTGHKGGTTRLFPTVFPNAQQGAGYPPMADSWNRERMPSFW
jgi:hypothetical protein